MLAQFALIAFALLALLSLIVDVGVLRLTQGQMQTAADAAALEGLRQRDVAVVSAATGQPTSEPYASDCLRRAAAHRFVRAVFDDDLEPGIEAEDDRFAAGPVIDLTGGIGSLHAGAALAAPAARGYEPVLQLNQSNVVDGDMVSGRFCYSAAPGPSESAAYGIADVLVCSDEQRAAGAYARNDFNPSTNPPPLPATLPDCPLPDEAPPEAWPVSGEGSLTTDDHSAFLVRLRRSNELSDRAGQVEPGLASSGPSLPLLFGRGAPIHGDDPASPYSVRRDGFTVRATAIAAVRPAWQVGLPLANPASPGVMPLTLVDTWVQALTEVPTPATINPATGLLCSGLACVGPNPATAVGRFVDNFIDPTRARWTTVSTVGQALAPAVPVACALATPLSGYGPVYALMAAGANRVIGFAHVSVARDPARPALPCAVVVTKRAARIAAANATALVGDLSLPAGVSPADLRELIDRHLQQNGRLAYGPVLVPVLAR